LAKWLLKSLMTSNDFKIIIVLMNSTRALEPIYWESFFLMINFNELAFFEKAYTKT